jgi:N-acyl homoserine lactone hydrolase
MSLTRNKKRALVVLFTVLAAGLLVALVGFRPTTHPAIAADLGTASSARDLEAVLDVPGPIRVETVTGADWEVPRSGLINLKSERARAAGLTDGAEPIQIFFHVLHHPRAGAFMIDTGVERALGAAPERSAIRGLVARVMNLDKLHVVTDTATWLERQHEPLSGVLFTHLHLDHVSGLPDVPRGTPLYAGPGETRERAFLNLFVQPVVDRELAGHGPIRELRFKPDPSGTFAGVLDLFGDQTVFALWVPGHTAGSTAYLARTPDGPVMFTGDACHTAWGWEHDVEPGSFSQDRARSAESLSRLEAFVKKHPTIDVRLGHQRLDRAKATVARAKGATSRPYFDSAR